MPNVQTKTCTAFVGTRHLASGSLIDVALAVKAAEMAGRDDPILTFDDTTGAVVDLDLRGDTADIVARLAPPSDQHAAATEIAETPMKGPGRPKLGVVAREVTLLPRHWEWLARQPGGASQMLRRLIDEARRADNGATQAKAARDRTYRFLSALAGDLPGFEDMSRALFAGDQATFVKLMAPWPADVRRHALKLTAAAQPEDPS